MSDDFIRVIAQLEATNANLTTLLARIEADSKDRDEAVSKRLDTMHRSATARIDALERKANAVVLTVLMAVLAQVLKIAGIGL